MFYFGIFVICFIVIDTIFIPLFYCKRHWMKDKKCKCLTCSYCHICPYSEFDIVKKEGELK